MAAVSLADVGTAETEEGPTRISLVSAVPTLEPIRIEPADSLALLATSLDSSEVHRRPLEQLPAELDLDLAAGSRWQLSIEGPRYWALDRIIEAGPAEEQRLEIWPAAWISGRILLPDRDAELPPSIETRFQKGATDPGLDGFETLQCPIEEGRLSCKVPAGVLDLRLSLPGLVPIYLWDRNLPPGQVSTLPNLAFRRGSSIVGWVLAESGALTQEELAEVEVVLSPGVISQVAESRATERQDAMNRRATPGPRGFFQVTGIDPGIYEVRADHPRYAAAQQRPVLLEADAELELEPLELPPATSLEVRLSLPTDPYLKPWEVALYRRGADQTYLEEIAIARADTEGRHTFEDLSPGTYLLYARNSRGATWFHDSVELVPGPNSFDAKVDFTRLEGLVTLDGEPVPHYDAIFSDPLTGRRVHYGGNEEGRFFAFLPVDVSWKVEVDHPGRGIHARFFDLTVPPKAEEDRWPKIELEIPDTRVEGQVVDSAHQPLTHQVYLEVSSREMDVLARTDGEGAFELVGLAPQEEYTVRARTRDEHLQSELVTFGLASGGRVGPLTLVLDGSHRVSGQVVGPRGESVAATRIVAEPRFETGNYPITTTPVAFTDLAGVFDLALPRGTDRYWLTFYPPGFAARQVAVDLPLEEPLLVPVDEEAGTLIVRYEDPPEIFQDASIGRFSGENLYLKIHTVLVAEGPISDFFAQSHWRDLHSTPPDGPFRYTLPRLAPGTYSACFGSNFHAALSQGRPLPAEIEERYCDSGFLSAGGELVLTLPASAYDAKAAELRAQEAASAESR